MACSDLCDEHVPILAVDARPILAVDARDSLVTARLERRRLLATPIAALTLFLGLVGFVSFRALLRPPPDPRQAAIGTRNTFLAELTGGRICYDFPGVQVAQPPSSAESLWPSCVQKWSVDCTSSGCCQDAKMQCYEKNSKWAACMESCTPLDANNETWTCRTIKPALEHSWKSCKDSCQQTATCQQAIFDSDAGGTCLISSERHMTVAWASDNFNTSFCGGVGESDMIKELMQEVSGQLPWRMPEPVINNCSWGGEDCSQTKCCNNVACDEKFTGCYPYSCYRKTDYFAGCRQHEPPKDWEGTWLGGGRPRRTIAAAGSQVLVQETSLYCFIVVNWHAPAPKKFWSTEAQLVHNMKVNGVGIYQCDGHDLYAGQPVPKAKWGSYSNIDAFLKVWQEVKTKGRYWDFAWTVKVDADAVFFPNRLKAHLDILRAPRGAKLYIENNGYQFKFMGALEVISREALTLFLANGQSCIRGKHEGGEDFFMKGCMDALGIDHQSDMQLLWDKYAGQDAPCTDGWAVAYHFHKKIISWNWCYNEAVCGGRKQTCPKGLPVKYVAPFGTNHAKAKKTKKTAV